MTRYYCRKCGIDSPYDTCPQCGKKLPANTLRNVWRVYRTPGTDSNSYRSAFAALSAAVILALIVLLLAAFLDEGAGGPLAFFTSGAFISVIMVLPLGMIFTAIFLFLQGREILDYSLDARGAHIRSLQENGKYRSWARLQTAPVKTLENNGDMAAISVAVNGWEENNHV